MSKKYDHPVYEHPETGKVINPVTENWISQKYAQNIGVLSEAKQKTADHFREIDETGRDSDLEAKADRAAQRVVGGSDESGKETLNAQTESDPNKDQLDETARVEWDEDGNEQRFDHDEWPDRTPESDDPNEALNNIMNDIDQADQSGRAVDRENFVDPEAEPQEPQEGSQKSDPHAQYKGENVEDYDGPQHLNLPSFPGGVYSTKNQEERARRARMQQRQGNRQRPEGEHRAKRNKDYKINRKTGGIKVTKKNKDGDGDN